MPRRRRPFCNLPLVIFADGSLRLLMLLLLYITSCGERVGLATLGLCSLPICLLGGPLCASLTLFVVLLIAGRTNLLLSNHDRSAVDALALPRAALGLCQSCPGTSQRCLGTSQGRRRAALGF